ncbi:MAG: class I SAM-dependent methyltransferase [Deltaproteobacteria bacterium]|jgi:SAM-dependent methyltransferase|nr:class I SAM-dependent methyltransferase [Deltaproteobacteria bacterium]
MSQPEDSAAQKILPEDIRYDHWYNSPAGLFALLAQESMVRKMTSGWPRRGHKLLELYCGAGQFLEAFWQSGFDVTGQERSAYLLEKARDRLRHTADFTGGHPEHLPFDDKSFDYVVCLNGLEFAERPQAVLAEMLRLASLGLLLAFPNSWSWYSLGRLLAVRKGAQAEKSCCSGFKRTISPLRMHSWLREAGLDGKIRWGANLLGPACTWRMHKFLGRINLISVPLPLGAFSLARIDLAPSLAGNQLLVNVRRPLTTKAAAGSTACANPGFFPQDKPAGRVSAPPR